MIRDAQAKQQRLRVSALPRDTLQQIFPRPASTHTYHRVRCCVQPKTLRPAVSAFSLDPPRALELVTRTGLGGQTADTANACVVRRAAARTGEARGVHEARGRTAGRHTVDSGHLAVLVSCASCASADGWSADRRTVLIRVAPRRQRRHPAGSPHRTPLRPMRGAHSALDVYTDTRTHSIRGCGRHAPTHRPGAPSQPKLRGTASKAPVRPLLAFAPRATE